MNKVLIVTSRYYPPIASELEQGAIAELHKHPLEYEMVEVPGALEIPTAIAIAAARHSYAAYVALGCVIRGETSHYDIVAGESARALMDLAISKHLAVGNGILTTENEQQAMLRAKISEGNKGAHAARAALALMQLSRQWVS